MIYEFKDTIVHLYKCFIHFFRALFCKDYYTESHGLGMCGQYGRIDANGKYRFCEYRWCPKRKSNADNAFQSVESVETMQTEREDEMTELEKRVEWLELQMRLVHRTLDKIDHKTEPQYDIDKGTIKCDNCSENGSYKCSKCDGEIYFKRLEIEDEPQTDCSWR